MTTSQNPTDSAAHPGSTTSSMNGSLHAGLRPEAELLLACASVCETCADGQRLQELLGYDLDWTSVLERAKENRLLPQLYLRLQSVDWHRVPPEATERIRGQFLGSAHHNLLLFRELIAIGRLLSSEGIEAATYKGPTLANLIYGDLAHRQCWDIDLLIHPDHIERARELVISRGYKPCNNGSPDEAADCRRNDCEYNFESPDTGVHVELHWQVLPDKHNPQFENDLIWDALRPYGGDAEAGIQVLRDEMLFLVLCLHGSRKHQWSRMRWILDIARFLEVRSRTDWRHVADEARRMKLDRSVALGAYLARVLLGATLPPPIADLVERNPSVVALAALARGRLFRPGMGLPGFREWHCYMRTHEDGSAAHGKAGLMDRLRYFRVVMTPEWHDRECLPATPRFLHFLAGPVRVMRLFRQHKTDLVKRTT